MDYRESCGIKEQFLGLGLTSRRNLCIHPEVYKLKKYTYLFINEIKFIKYNEIEIQTEIHEFT